MPKRGGISQRVILLASLPTRQLIRYEGLAGLTGLTGLIWLKGSRGSVEGSNQVNNAQTWWLDCMLAWRKSVETGSFDLGQDV